MIYLLVLKKSFRTVPVRKITMIKLVSTIFFIYLFVCVCVCTAVLDKKVNIRIDKHHQNRINISEYFSLGHRQTSEEENSRSKLPHTWDCIRTITYFSQLTAKIYIFPFQFDLSLGGWSGVSICGYKCPEKDIKT